MPIPPPVRSTRRTIGGLTYQMRSRLCRLILTVRCFPTPPTDIHAEFKTADGKVWSAYVGKVQHFEWHHSPQLLASMVAEELRTGKFTYPQEAL